MASRLLEVAILFTRLGFTAFGGPAAHVALIEDEVVSRRKWLDRQHFLDLVATLNFIPGPNSTELAIHLGMIRAGYPGLFVAGFCFITPAVLIILPIAWMYVHYAGQGVQPPAMVMQALLGIRAIVVAVLAVTAVRLIRSAIRSRFALTIALLAVVAELLIRSQSGWQSEIIVLALAGIAGALFWRATPAPPSTTLHATPLPAEPSPEAASPSARLMSAGVLSLALPAGWSGSMLELAWFFLKVGGTLFGSGYVLVNYLETGLVRELGWLTNQQLADAVAIGQFTPGPLLTTATFVGYLRGFAVGGDVLGIIGAIVATVAIFAPAFIFVGLLGPLLPRIRAMPRARAALDAMNASVVALLVLITLRMAGTSFAGISQPDFLAIALCALAVAAMLKWNVNSTWLILLGASAGVVRSLL